ncbi:hypothetical protein D3C81_1477070 [compost metagenome]
MQRRDFTSTNSNVATDHATVADELVHDFGRQLERDRKTDAFRRFTIVALIKGEGVDAHQLAEGVHQRAARVTVVDGGIRLQEILSS